MSINLSGGKNLMEIIKTISEIVIGVTASISLWLSRKALKKSDWNSAMNTSPSITLTTREIWVGTRNKDNNSGGWSGGAKKIIVSDSTEVSFNIEFECSNVGRGVAFNISQPKSWGVPISDFRPHRAPLYLTTGDNSFNLELQLTKTSREWYSIANEVIPVRLEINYTNDQGNVYCKSFWAAEIKPFDISGRDLDQRDEPLVNQSGGVRYFDHLE